jgi:hypothetical protein
VTAVPLRVVLDPIALPPEPVMPVMVTCSRRTGRRRQQELWLPGQLRTGIPVRLAVPSLTAP